MQSKERSLRLSVVSVPRRRLLSAVGLALAGGFGIAGFARTLDLRPEGTTFDLASYNSEQERRAGWMARQGTFQGEEPSCQTHALTGLAFLIGLIDNASRIVIKDQGTDKEGLTPNEMFRRWEKAGINPRFSYEEIAGQWFGESQVHRFRYDPREKLKLIVDSLDQGRPVFVALYAKPIWELVSERKQGGWWNHLRHTLIVTGVRRGDGGEVAGLFVRDSGLGRSYLIDVLTFLDAIDARTLRDPLHTAVGNSTVIVVPSTPAIDDKGQPFAPILYVSPLGTWRSLDDNSFVTIKPDPARAGILHLLNDKGVFRGEITRDGQVLSALRYRIMPQTFIGCRDEGVVLRATFSYDEQDRLRLDVFDWKQQIMSVDGNCRRTPKPARNMVFVKDVSWGLAASKVPFKFISRPPLGVD